MADRPRPPNLRFLPGERVLAWAPAVRRRAEPELPGTLICTNLRVAFRPRGEASGGAQDAPLNGNYDWALTNIRQLVAAWSGPTRPQPLRPGVPPRSVPEELLVLGRDFRQLRVGFGDGGPDAGASQVTTAIVRAWQQSSQAGRYEETQLSGCGRGLGPGEPPVPLWETPQDWEAGLQRQGAGGWRVSLANQRFDVAASLSPYFWVPSRTLDSEIRRAFGHFQQSRGPRLSWHHRGGGDLLRAGGFHPASDPETQDVRAAESLLLAGHSECVLVDTAEELPSLADIQLSHTRLASLCLSDAPPAQDKWLSALEGTRWLEHVRSCLRKASDISVLVTTRRLSVVLQEPGDRDLNCLVSSLVQLLSEPEARTLGGIQSLVQREWVAAGHPFRTRLDPLGSGRRGRPGDQAPVFLLFLDCAWQVLAQFPGQCEFSESFLLALHDAVRLPDSSTFLHDSAWERGRGARGAAGGPGAQVRTRPPRDEPQNPGRGLDAPPTPIPHPLPVYTTPTPTPTPTPRTVWDWGLRCSGQQRARFRNPCYAPDPPPPGRPPGPSRDKPGPGAVGVWLLSRGSLSPLARLCPWRPRPDPAPAALLGPLVRLWKRCYLRGGDQDQPGLSGLTVSGLSEELRSLQQLLTHRPSGPPPDSGTLDPDASLSPSR
ncbi:myotubularin-related protein 11 [Ornithorhynchus anatinus]|uniref:myotubularin-related protein 11 n=1 Tax=Ornithorhynchus anatinus TaxID=9258 RepID=UPI0010A7C9CD|nr:myotubularin-related protein 11 [Ornithorhynchus anatinus]